MNRMLSILILVVGCFAVFASTAEAGYIDGMSQYRAYFVPGTMDPLGEHTLSPDKAGCFELCLYQGGSPEKCSWLCLAEVDPSKGPVLWGEPVADFPDTKVDSACNCISIRGHRARPQSRNGTFPVRPGQSHSDCDENEIVILKYEAKCKEDCGCKCYEYIKWKCEKKKVSKNDRYPEYSMKWRAQGTNKIADCDEAVF